MSHHAGQHGQLVYIEAVRAPSEVLVVVRGPEQLGALPAAPPILASLGAPGPRRAAAAALRVRPKRRVATVRRLAGTRAAAEKEAQAARGITL